MREQRVVRTVRKTSWRTTCRGGPPTHHITTHRHITTHHHCAINPIISTRGEGKKLLNQLFGETLWFCLFRLTKYCLIILLYYTIYYIYYIIYFFYIILCIIFLIYLFFYIIQYIIFLQPFSKMSPRPCPRRVQPAHIHGTAHGGRRLVRMAELPTMDSVTACESLGVSEAPPSPNAFIPPIPTISITPHSPVVNKPFPVLGETILL